MKKIVLFLFILISIQANAGKVRDIEFTIDSTNFGQKNQ